MDTTSFNWVDWGIIGIVGLSVFLSLWRGFTREALSLVGWIAGFVLASRYSGWAAEYLEQWISGDLVRQVVAFVLILAACLIITSLLARLLTSLIEAVGLSVFDRLLGSAFGFVRGVVILLIVSYAIKLLVPQAEYATQQSVLMPHVDTLLNWSQSRLQDARITTI